MKNENGKITELAIPQDINYFKKSNVLLSAKYRSSLIENKILAFSLANIDRAVDDKEGFRVSFGAAELKQIIKTKSGSFYDELKMASKIMLGRTIGIEDPQKNFFEYVTIIVRARYENGTFDVWFNKALQPLLLNIEKNFSILNLRIMMSFKSVYSFRLYEVLKSKAYNKKWENSDNNKFVIEYGTSELKLLLGVVNAENDAVKKELVGKEYPDFDKAVAKATEKMQTDWNTLRRSVIDVAVKEINEKADINVSYKTKKNGKGGRVVRVIFTVENKIKENPEPSAIEATQNGIELNISEEEKEEMLIMLKMKAKKIGYIITLKEAEDICKVANYDKFAIEKAMVIMRGNKTEIEDPVKWLIGAIRNNYIASKAQLERAKENGAMEKVFSKLNIDDFYQYEMEDFIASFEQPEDIEKNKENDIDEDDDDDDIVILDRRV